MRNILANLIRLADHLDNKGYEKEANFADGIIKEVKAAMDEKEEEKEEMAPEMKDDKEMEEAESCVMKDADANLKKVQMRRRARDRRIVNKAS